MPAYTSSISNVTFPVGAATVSILLYGRWWWKAIIYISALSVSLTQDYLERDSKEMRDKLEREAREPKGRIEKDTRDVKDRMERENQGRDSMREKKWPQTLSFSLKNGSRFHFDSFYIAT